MILVRIPHLHTVLATCVLIMMVEPVLGANIWAWFYRTRDKDRCTGANQYSREVKLNDGGECINHMGGHDGSLWLDISGGPGKAGCLFMYEADDCRGYTTAWQLAPKNWCYEMPRVEGRTFSSYRYVGDSCWPDREEKPRSTCQVAHDGQKLIRANICVNDEDPETDG